MSQTLSKPAVYDAWARACLVFGPDSLEAAAARYANVCANGQAADVAPAIASEDDPSTYGEGLEPLPALA